MKIYLKITICFQIKRDDINSQVRKNAEELRNECKDDLSTLFANECVH